MRVDLILLCFISFDTFSALHSQSDNVTLEPVENQLKDYAAVNKEAKMMTSSYGAPVGDVLNSLTAGKNGPMLIQDTTFFEVIQSFTRERIPERVVHGKGAGAFGYFEVTNDISMYSAAQVFSKVGLKTDVAVRFSPVIGESGSADTVRDVRGFAVKFYTGEGNWDLLSISMPVFSIRDAIEFPQLIHAMSRNPQTHLHDNNMFWDFVGHRPETINAIMYLHSAFGIPYSYTTMNGFSVNAFKLVNRSGNFVYTKFHWRPRQGVANLTVKEAQMLASTQPDYYTQDLFDVIAKNNFPRWNLSIQVMTPDQASKFKWNPFDPTKEWPESEFPLKPVGVLVLNRNQKNYFVEVEELAFSPSRLVPGIELSPDKLLQGRLFIYPDAQNYRLGSNNQQLKVNKPYTVVTNYERDGFASPGDNQGDGPDYYPNSFHGPEPSSKIHSSPFFVNGSVMRYNTTDEDNFSQPKLLWEKMNRTERQHMVDNIISTLSRTYPIIQHRVLENFYQVSQEFASRLASKLGVSIQS